MIISKLYSKMYLSTIVLSRVPCDKFEFKYEKYIFSSQYFFQMETHKSSHRNRKKEHLKTKFLFKKNSKKETKENGRKFATRISNIRKQHMESQFTKKRKQRMS